MKKFIYHFYVVVFSIIGPLLTEICFYAIFKFCIILIDELLMVHETCAYSFIPIRKLAFPAGLTALEFFCWWWFLWSLIRLYNIWVYLFSMKCGVFTSYKLSSAFARVFAKSSKKIKIKVFSKFQYRQLVRLFYSHLFFCLFFFQLKYLVFPTEKPFWWYTKAFLEKFIHLALGRFPAGNHLYSEMFCWMNYHIDHCAILF